MPSLRESHASERCYGSGCCVRVRVPTQQRRRAWAAMRWAAMREREHTGEGGGRRGRTHCSLCMLEQMPVHSSVGVHACMRMSARTHGRPITSCVVGVLASAGMAKAPSGTDRQGRVSLCGVWGGRTVLGAGEGGRARVGERWQVLGVAGDCSRLYTVCWVLGTCVQSAATLRTRCFGSQHLAPGCN